MDFINISRLPSINKSARELYRMNLYIFQRGKLPAADDCMSRKEIIWLDSSPIFQPVRNTVLATWGSSMPTDPSIKIERKTVIIVVPRDFTG